MVARLASCHVYPVKAMAGSAPTHLDITDRGPAGDRRFMLLYADDPRAGRFVTQRDRGMERLARLRAGFDGQRLTLTMPDGATCAAHVPPATAPLIDTKVFDDPVQVQAVDGRLDALLSSFLGTSVQLTYQPNAKPRPAGSYGRDGDQVGLADGYAVLIANLASLDALNEHIDPSQRIGMDRFRPNLVVDGLAPFEEETIQQLHIGSVAFELVKPCTRCTVPNVDQATGTIGAEPGAALRRLRFGKADGLMGTFFGVNAQPRSRGTVRVGDPVEVLTRCEQHPAVAATTLGFNRSPPS